MYRHFGRLGNVGYSLWAWFRPQPALPSSICGVGDLATLLADARSDANIEKVVCHLHEHDNTFKPFVARWDVDRKAAIVALASNKGNLAGFVATTPKFANEWAFTSGTTLNKTDTDKGTEAFFTNMWDELDHTVALTGKTKSEVIKTLLGGDQSNSFRSQFWCLVYLVKHL